MTDPIVAAVRARMGEGESDNPLRSRIYRGTELDVLADPEPLVPELVMRDSICAIYGPSGAGKTFYALAAAASVASGHAFFGREVHQGPVLYVAAEGVRGIKLRQRAWLEHHGMADSALADLYWVRGAVDLLNGADVERVGELADEIGAVWTIFDTLARNTPGSDEGAKDMSNVVGVFDYLRGCGDQPAISPIHHTGKDLSRGLRGHTALLGALDTEIEVTGDHGLIKVRVTKQKDGEEAGPWQYNLTPAAGSVVLTSTVLGTAIDRRINTLLGALETLDAGHGVSTSDWLNYSEERLDIRRSSFNDAKAEAARRSLVVQNGPRQPWALSDMGKQRLRDAQVQQVQPSPNQ